MESLGTRLKREREKQNLSLEEVASATKIASRMLKALEDDQFEKLPGGIFNKGFVRAYATHLGLNGDQAVADYLTATGGGPAPKPAEVVLAELATRAETRAREKRPAKEVPWGRLAILLLLVALGFTIWGSYSRKNSPSPTPPGPLQTTPAQTPSASPQDAATPVPIRVQRTSPPPSPAPQAGAARSKAPPPSDAKFSVLIQAQADSWLRVVADGKEVMHELLPAHSETTVSASRELVVRAGNVGGLEFSFNGHKLPAQGEQNAVKVLTFDSHGLRAAAPEVRSTSTPLESKP